MNNQNQTERTPWEVTLSVWNALFLRESTARLAAERLAWFWMIAEPVSVILIMVAIRSVILNGKIVSGVDFIPWLVVGLFGFYLFRENMIKSLGAIDANRALFSYRQVLAIDTVFVRCFIEGLLKTIIFVLFILAASIFEIGITPDNPLGSILIWIAIWLFGAGIGTLLSSAATLIPEIGKIVRVLSLPLLLISGVLFPISLMPYELKQYILINPIVHCLELLRSSFFMSYTPDTKVSLLYIIYWTMASWSLGLILHLRYSERIKAQ